MQTFFGQHLAPRPVLHLEHPLQMGLDQTADARLLPDQRLGRIDRRQAKFVDNVLVFPKDAALEQPKRFVWIIRQPQILAGLVILELRSANQDALERLVEWHAKIKSQGRTDGKTID